LVGCSIGISPGFAPFRILSTRSPARRYRSKGYINGIGAGSGGQQWLCRCRLRSLTAHK
jgi:hypothetical protein